jgi:4-hydroxy-tetrahydrodipicolinate synthase
MLAIGARGSISVISNILPTEINKLWEYFQQGELSKSRDIQIKLYPLISLLFSDVNPIPIKTALAKMKLCEEEFRLPLYNMNKQKKELLFKEMKKISLI